MTAGNQNHPVTAATENFSDIAKDIEAGNYYRQARDWYDITYIAPISQRIIFMVVAFVAAFTSLMAWNAIQSLLPLNTPTPVARYVDNVDDYQFRTLRLRAEKEDINQAMLRYFISAYIETREEYAESSFRTQMKFVKYYSSADVFRQFFQTNTPNNPQSPIRRYAKHTKKKVEIQSVRINQEVTPMTATIYFSSYTEGRSAGNQTAWVAVMQFDYKPLVEKNIKDENNPVGYTLDLQEPEFSVISYQLNERIAANNP